MTIEKQVERMSMVEKMLLADIINHDGSGQHPAATPSTLPYFEKEYVLECINTAYSRLSPGYQTIADGIKLHL